MEKAKNLEIRQKKLKEKMLSTVVDERLGKSNKRFRLNGYMYDLRVNYGKEEFDFLSGDFAIDDNGVLWICLGVGRSPNSASGEVLWFLSEVEKVNFVDNFLPENFYNSFAKAPSLVA